MKHLRKYILLISVLISSVSGTCQLQNQVADLLAKKDLSALQAFTDKIQNQSRDSGATGDCAILRDIVEDYREAIFYFERTVPDSFDRRISAVYTYRAQVITHGRDIIFYEYGEQRNRKVNNEWKPYYDVIDRYRNKEELHKLHDTYRSVYEAQLDEAELFDESITYGSHCGFAGTDPRWRTQMDDWVRHKDRNAMILWLRSPNVEKQMYAVDGFYWLKRSGVKLTDQELHQVKIVLGKQGEVRICRGCIYSNEGIAEALRGFNFK